MLTIDSLKHIATRLYPTKARKFRVVERRTYTMADYWDGGTREYATAVNLATGETKPPAQAATIPFNNEAHATFEIPPGVGIITHQIFCGKDAGITVYVAPGEAARFLPPSERLTLEQPAISMAELVGVLS